MVIISVIASHWYATDVRKFSLSLSCVCRCIFCITLLLPLTCCCIPSHCPYYTCSSNLILVDNKVDINKEEGRKQDAVTYGDVAEATFGKWGLVAVDALLMFTQFGFCCVYIIFVSSNTANFFIGMLYCVQATCVHWCSCNLTPSSLSLSLSLSLARSLARSVVCVCVSACVSACVCVCLRVCSCSNW
jgi:hypothetical protein